MILQVLDTYNILKNNPINRIIGALYEYLDKNYIIDLLLYPIDQVSKIFLDITD